MDYVANIWKEISFVLCGDLYNTPPPLTCARSLTYSGFTVAIPSYEIFIVSSHDFLKCNKFFS